MKIQLVILLAAVFVASPVLAADEMMKDASKQDQQAAAPATPAQTGSIARSAFTTAVENREPVDSINKLGTETDKVYYFTELKGMDGQQITHRWEYNGKVMAEVPFQVGGSRWRVFSSKNLEEIWQGEWKVSVIDAKGGTLSVNTFTYTGDANSGEMKKSPETATQ